MLLDNKTTVFIRCKKPMREKKGVVGATFSRPLAAECRPYVIHAIALSDQASTRRRSADSAMARQAKSTK
jgi:hypothetical protein